MTSGAGMGWRSADSTEWTVRSELEDGDEAELLASLVELELTWVWIGAERLANCGLGGKPGGGLDAAKPAGWVFGWRGELE